MPESQHQLGGSVLWAHCY